ncbi:MAG: CZB domain-containing protein [Helicobacteraceae bacterium]|nr:CZB domain-containing protein [Helicobacteraceae bacterium]
MTKQQTLDSIQTARKYHEVQMQKISALVSGKTIVDPTSVSKRECAFGQWIYDEEKHLRVILGSQFYEAIEQLHGKWHEQYYKIYEIFFTKPKNGLFSKVLKLNKVSMLELDKAKLYYAELQQNTQELLKMMSISERRVMALSDSKFAKSLS